MSFVVKLARTQSQQERAASIRERAYAKHLPSLAEIFAGPDNSDFSPDSVLIYCEDRKGNVVGSVRMTENYNKPLPLEKGLMLPIDFIGVKLAEITRLVVPPHHEGKLIKTLLFKAIHLYSFALQIKLIFAAVRYPLNVQYEKLGFDDVIVGRGFVASSYTFGIPHMVLKLEIPSLERRWKESKHTYYDFFFTETHSEIKIFESATSIWARSRERSDNTFPNDSAVLSDLTRPSSNN